MTDKIFIFEWMILANFMPCLMHFCMYVGTENTIIGQIDQELLDKFFENEDYRDFYVNTGGIYLLPEPVPFNGKIIMLRAYGFVDWTLDTTDLDAFIPQPEVNNSGAFLYVLVYRPSENGSIYNLVHDLTQLNHRYTPGRLPQNAGGALSWGVKQGDLIGVYIPQQCVNKTGSYLCPSQVNLKTNDCLSAFYHPALEGVDNLHRQEFKEVQLQLNLAAFISPADKCKFMFRIAIIDAARYNHHTKALIEIK